MDEQVGFAALRKKVAAEMPFWAQKLPELPSKFHGFLNDVRELRISSHKQQLALANVEHQLIQHNQSQRRIWVASLIFITAAATLGILLTGQFVPPIDFSDYWNYGSLGIMLLSLMAILRKPR